MRRGLIRRRKGQAPTDRGFDPHRHVVDLEGRSFEVRSVGRLQRCTDARLDLNAVRRIAIGVERHQQANAIDDADVVLRRLVAGKLDRRDHHGGRESAHFGRDCRRQARAELDPADEDADRSADDIAQQPVGIGHAGRAAVRGVLRAFDDAVEQHRRANHRRAGVGGTPRRGGDVPHTVRAAAGDLELTCALGFVRRGRLPRHADTSPTVPAGSQQCHRDQGRERSVRAQVAMTKARERLRPGDPAREMIDQRIAGLRDLMHARIEDVPTRTGIR